MLEELDISLTHLFIDWFGSLEQVKGENIFP